MKEKHTSNGGSTDYYNIPKGTTDIQDLIEYLNMNFSMGNIFKACWRIGRKEGIDDLYDLNKIIFFAEREKERILSSLGDTTSILPKEDVNITQWVCNSGYKSAILTGIFKIEVLNRNGEINILTNDNAIDWRIIGAPSDIMYWRLI